MNTFGDFLYTLRKEKGMTQADLAERLGVTNKAVSKWETGEAMPETALLLPLSRILGVTVDELLSGARQAPPAGDTGENRENDEDRDEWEDRKERLHPHDHLFTRGKDDKDEPMGIFDRIRELCCSLIFFSALALYLLLGILKGMWHPYWAIIPLGLLVMGIIGNLFDLCNPEKRRRKREKGEDPVCGAICGIVMLSCLVAYGALGWFLGLWHPYWIIPGLGALFCIVIRKIGDIFRTPTH